MAVKVLTQENFDETIRGSKLPVIVDFYADWCGPCRMIAPIMEEISTEMPDKVLACKINVDENEAVARQFNVMSIPFVMCFKDGKPHSSLVGAVPKSDILALTD